MTKIGRNEKCQCGSGKKYKKCCLQNGDGASKTEKVIIDASTMIHNLSIKNGFINQRNTTVSYSELLNEFIATSGLSIGSNNFLERYLDFVNNKIIELCNHHSSYELFFWYRRIKPTKINNATAEMAYAYRSLLNSCAVQHGKKIDKFIINSENDITPAYVDDFLKKRSTAPPPQAVKILRDIYKLESLCFYYIFLRNNQRNRDAVDCLCVPDTEFGIRYRPRDNSKNKFLDIYDCRASKTSMLTPIGSVSYEDASTKKGTLNIAGLQYNFDEIKIPEELGIRFMEEYGTSNFMPRFINIDSYYELLKKLNGRIYARAGFYIEDFLSIILCFSVNLASIMTKSQEKIQNSEDIKRLHILLQRGYSLSDDSDEWRRSMVKSAMQIYRDHFQSTRHDTCTEKRVLLAYDFLFNSPKNFTAVEDNLLTTGIFTRVTTTKVIIDYSEIISTIRCFPLLLRGIDGEDANIISADFELKINSEIANTFGKCALFHRGQIFGKDGKSKEIDASFIYGDTLFVIECKSLDVSNNSLLAVGNAINFRRNKVDGYIKEVEAKVDFLVKNHNYLSKPIPNSVFYITSLVATSWGELLCDDKYFITTKLSRIVLLQEINQLYNSEILDIIKQKPYTKKISN